MRDAYPAALIQIAVLAKERKALVVYGSGHLQRKQLLSNFDMDAWQTQALVSLLERSGPGRVFVILPHLRRREPLISSQGAVRNYVPADPTHQRSFAAARRSSTRPAKAA